MNRCVNCGMQLEDGMIFCPSCGVHVCRCGACGAPQREENRFCSMCGAKMKPQKADAEKVADAPAEADAEEVADAPAEVIAEEVADAPAEAVAEKVADAPDEAVAEKVADAPAEVIAEEAADAPAEAVAEKVADTPDEAVAEEAADVPAEAVAEEVSDVPAEVIAEKVADVPAEAVAEEVADVPAEAVAEEVAEEDDALAAPVLNESDTQKIVLPPPAEMEREPFDEDEQPSRSWYQRNRRPLLLGAIFVILVAILSSWFFSRQMREDEYQERMTSICSSMTSLHQDVLRQMDMLDAKNRTQIAAHLTKRLEALRKIKEEQAEMRAPSSLSEENNKIAEILDLEERILSQIELFCREPLTVEPSEGRQMIGDWAKEADELYRSVDLDAPFDKVPSLQRAARPIYEMMETERKLEEQRLKDLAIRKTFLEGMDVIVNDYNAKKDELNAILEAAHSGDTDSYRVRLAEARSARETLRSRMYALEVPQDAKPLIAQFNEALSLSIHCCDVMSELANPLTAVLQGNDVYNEARAINSKIQETYNAFVEKYEAYKAADEASQDGEQEPADE